MATPPQPPTALETATAEAAESLAAMEAEAAELFAAQGEQRTAPAPAAKEPAKEPAAEPAKPAPAKAKLPPHIKPIVPSAAKPVAAATEPPVSKEPDASKAPDFSDIPKEYTPGQTRAPQWNKLHAKADHYEALALSAAQERDALRAELEAAKAAPSNGEPGADIALRLKTIQEERDALQARLEAVAVERSPRFEAQFKPRRDAAIAQAKAAVGPENAARIEALLAMPESSYRDEQVEALLASLTPLRATKLTQSVADLDRLAAERAQLAERGSELWKTWTAEEAASRDRASAARTAEAARTFDSTLKEWETAGLTAEEVTQARSVYTGQNATLADAATAALWGAVGPRVVQQLNDANARVAELEGELGKLRAAQPGVGAGGSGALPSTPPDEDDPSTTSYIDRIVKEANRAGLRFGG